MLKFLSFSTDADLAGRQPSPPLFDSLINDTLFHISHIMFRCSPVVAYILLDHEWTRCEYIHPDPLVCRWVGSALQQTGP